MDIHASLRYLRMAPRKVRLVINAVRGLPVMTADTRLTFMKQAAVEPVQKLLRSAIPNAEHNFHLKKEDLIVKTITAEGGPTIKRSRPRSRGSAAPIRKRTTHIMIVLAPKAGAQAVSTPTASEGSAPKTPAKKTVARASASKPARKTNAAAKTA